MNYFARKPTPPREKDDRDIVFDARPPEPKEAAEEVISITDGLQRLGYPMPPTVDLAALGAEIERKPLDEIARLIRSLTYGEMMEMSEQTGVAPDVFHKWSKGR